MKKEMEYIPICQWDTAERPRERLLREGRNSLSDAELLAVIMGSGTREANAIDLARQILLSSRKGFKGLEKLSASRLMQIKGVGQARAACILALVEFARRLAREPAEQHNTIGGSRDAYKELKPFLSDLPHEEFWILYLNNANRVMHRFQLSKGGLTATLVDVRLILKNALEVGAVGIILAHNHPSGKTAPSKADIQITKKIIKAAALMDLKVLDHLVISEAEYYSFADHQLI
ncbi:RadC family protein [Robiginitalea sp. IMCC44478]|uniref:RadC family protein n=1 Tax=Robiginitalea sp. IMCC44478 TaxID=3459122 RepID=UPI004043399D